MAVTPLKAKMGELIREYLAARKVRQCELAKALKVSNSAVSQMLSGRIVLNQEQLITVSTLLALPRDQYLELSAMAASIHSGVKNLRSRFNQLITSARCERGVDTRKLSNLTGVSAARLELLENCFNVIPTVDEIERLAPVLSCSREDMFAAAGMMYGGSADSEPAAAEKTTPYITGRKMLPVLTLPQLAKYTGEDTLHNFALSHSNELTERGEEIPVQAVAVRSSGDELKAGFSGEIWIFIGDERPPHYREIELMRDKRGNFRLRERRRGVWKLFHMPPDDHASGYAVWSRPVLELVLRPVRPRSEIGAK